MSQTTVPITEQTPDGIDEGVPYVGAWTCPLCSHSQSNQITICDGCGALRVGDQVVPPDAPGDPVRIEETANEFILQPGIYKVDPADPIEVNDPDKPFVKAEGVVIWTDPK